MTSHKFPGKNPIYGISLMENKRPALAGSLCDRRKRLNYVVGRWSPVSFFRSYFTENTMCLH